jgi:hypothetical protein
MLNPCEFISRIALRCACVSMSALLLLFQSRCYPVEFAPRTLDPLSRLLLLWLLHLRQRCTHPATDALEKCDGHIEIPL